MLNKTFFLLGTLGALTLAGCSSENDVTPDIPNASDISYVTVTIRNSDGASRAGEEFENGTEDESAINRLVLVFFDNNGDFVTYGEVTKDNISTTTQTTGGNVETVATAKVNVELKTDQATPTKVIAFINPISESDIKTSISSIQALKRTAYSTTTNGFAMNSSAYYDGNNLQIATAVSKENFAEKGSSTVPTAINIYVERIAAKVSLTGTKGASTITVADNKKNTDADGTTLTLKFVPEKWAINAGESSTYLLKHFLSKPTFSWTWNVPDNHRSYWANSVAHATTDFPVVSDDTQASGASYAKTYLSYNDITKENGEGAAVGSSLYTLESTIPASSFSYKSALPSVLLVGHYTIDGNEATTFYRRNGKIYVGDKIWTLFASISHALYVKDTSASDKITFKSLDGDALKAIAEITHPTATSLGGKVAEGYVIPQIKSGAILTGIYYFPDGAPASITDETEVSSYLAANKVSDINTRLYQDVGLTEAYTNGKAYFNIPIQHIGYNSNTDATQVEGAYGIVRNHSYKLTVSNIKDSSMGSGIFNLEIPIVPTTVVTEYEMNVSINVLAWHIVSQTVEL
jgi:hypothetical protein